MKQFHFILLLFFISIPYLQGQLLCDMVLETNCGNISGTNDTGQFSTDVYCGSSSNLTGPELVYLIIPSSTEVFSFDLTTFGAGADLDMFLLEGDCNSASCITNSDGPSASSPDFMTATLTSGLSYYLVIDGDNESISEFSLDITCSPPFECEFEDIECNETISSSNDTGNFGVDTYCAGSNINLTGSEKIFRFVPDNTQLHTIGLSGFSGDLDLFLLGSSCNTDDCLGNTDGPSSSSPDVLNINLIAGQEYFLVVDGDGGTISDFELSILCSEPCEANFSFTEDCGKVQFNNLSIGSNLSYEWQIDGVTYTEENPCVQFNDPGPHLVILTTLAFGCEDEFSIEFPVEICSQELFCACCPDGPQHNFEDEFLGPITTFPQAPWNAVYGNPIYVNEGCDDPVSPISIQITGPTLTNQGDGVELSLSGIAGPSILFEEGKQYCISFCYKAPEIDGNIKLRISDNAQTGGNCSGQCSVISTTPQISPTDGWQNHQFIFTATNDYYSLTFSTDATHPLDGTVPMLFDNVCVNEYTDSCQADFSWTSDGCGKLDLADQSCGDNLSYLWNINGNIYTTPNVSISGAGTYTISLTITGADGCSDNKTETITISSPTPPILTCPTDLTVTEIITPGVPCESIYLIPTISSNVPTTIICTFNGNIVSPGNNINLAQGNNTIMCTTVDECENMDQCDWNIFLQCEMEEPMGCDVDPNCDASDNLNLGTGIDLLGNQMASGSGQVDPIWKLINNAPVDITCTNANLASLNGSAYLTNYVFPNTTAWVNQPGVTVMAPMDLGNGNGAANQFGCNNILNSNGQRVPYIFERLFCICEEDEIDFQFSFKGDDRLTLELWNLTTNSIIGNSSTYNYPSAASVWNLTTTLPQGSYALRAKLANVSNTTLGFSIIGSATSSSGNNSIINVGTCCEAYTLNVRKILDNDCSGSITAGDAPGQAWNFILKDAFGTPIQTGTTDINGELFFTNLSLGNYTIEEVVLPGYTPISPVSGIQNITITPNSWNTYDFYNCESPEVVCDSLMVMVRDTSINCMDPGLITGNPCISLFDPVCGCDGQTYSNACFANEAGIAVYNAGACDGSNTPNPEELCCYAFDLKNNWGPDIVNVEVEMLTKDWIFNNVVLDPGYNFGPCLTANDEFCIEHNSGSIPTGFNMDALTACIAAAVSSPTAPQIIEFRWMQEIAPGENIVACRDTIELNCTPPPPKDPCVIIEEDDIMCSDPDNPLEYEYCFTLYNNSGFDIGSITLEDITSGFGWQPFCTTSTTVQPIPNPIPDGTSSGQICVKLKSTTPIITPQDVCFKIGVISTDGTECCHNPMEICKEIEPCCDPCEDNGIIATSYGGDDDCCYLIDVENGCQTGYYTKFEAEVLTPGVCFGSHTISPTQAGFWNVSSTNTSICMRPNSGTMGQASYPGLLDFCLDKINSPAQNNPQVIFRWYAVNPLTGVEEVVCTELLDTTCEFDENVCLIVSEPLLVCLPDSNKYRYTFTVTNTSFPSFTADKLHLTIKNDPFNYVPFPTGNIIPLSPPLGPNQSRTISTCIVGTPFPQTGYSDFVFGYRLQNMATGDCCFESKCDTIPIPPCGLDLCCDDFDEFCDLVDLGWDVTIDSCVVTVKATQFDSCHWMNYASPDWGDGSTNLPSVSPANGCWTHTYDQSGSYNICATIFEGTMDGDTCWTKEICVPIDVNCPSCECIGWSDVDISGTWGNNPGVVCGQTVTLPECEYEFTVDGSFLCEGGDCDPSFDWSMTKVGGNCVNPCIGNFGLGTSFNLNWDLSPNSDPLSSGPGTYELRINGNCGDDAPCDPCIIFIVIPECDMDCDPCDNRLINSNIGNNFSSLNLTPSQDGDFGIVIVGSLEDGTGPYLNVGIAGSATSDPLVQNILIDFDLENQLNCNDAQLIKVELQLFGDPSSTFGNIANNNTACVSVRRATSSWNESSLSGTSSTSVNEVFIAQPLLAAEDYVVDVTQLAQDILNNPGNDFGFMLHSQCTDETEIIFASKDHPNPALHPRLIVTYNDSNCNPSGDACCYNLDLGYQCPDSYFTKVTIECTTPGVDLGAFYVPALYAADWTATRISQDIIEWKHNTGKIPQGYYPGLIPFCFDDVDPSELSQSIRINWYGEDAIGNEILACTNDFDYNCMPEDPCDLDEDPCDFTNIAFNPDPVLGDLCCFTASIDNQYCDDYFKGIKISVSSPASISQVQALNGWVINQLDPLNAEIYPAGSFIPTGQEDIFRICAINDGSNFNVQISWLYADDDGNCISICPEDFDVSCDGNPGGCLEIIQDSIDCDNDLYCFRVLNTTTPEIIIKSVEFIQLSPNGASLTPNPYSINPLSSGDTSEWICVNYDALGNPDMCFLLVGHEADLPAGEPISWCCVDDEKYFINIEEDCSNPPPCPTVPNLCEDISVMLMPDPVTGEECCFVASITNDYCAEYFKGVKITTQSPATLSQLQTLNNWYIQQISSTEAEIYPAGNHVPLGTIDIFNVCNSSDISPFTVTISWLIPDDQGNCIEICAEDFDLTCSDDPPGGCISVVEEELRCDEKMYCFKITNNTSPGFTIQSIDLINISPTGATLSPNPISIPPLLAGETSDWICVSYDGIADGDDLCFFVVGHNSDISQGDIPMWCCATAEPICVEIACGDFCPPDCISIVQDSLSCIDKNYCFKIVNNTHPGFDINSIDLINILPTGADFLNTPIGIPTLMVGDTSDWICVEYLGVEAGDSLCFNVVAHLEDLSNDETPTWCCATNEPYCVVIEDCDVCCDDEEAFLDLVDLGFMHTIDGCELSINTMQFDSCHWMTSAEPDWGDGSVSADVIIPANGSWTHSYTASGTYTVCIEVFEGDNEEENCWSASYCEDIVIDCGEPLDDNCDLDQLLIPNGLTPNGDGLNDVLKIEKGDDCPEVMMIVYNRWGQMVYRDNDYNNNWGGESRNNLALPDGTYYLVVGFDDESSDPIHTFVDIRR